MRRAIWIAALFGAAAATAGTVCADPKPVPAPAPAPKADDKKAEPPRAIEKARLEIQPAGKALTKLAIDNPLGNVRIEGYDGTALQIETRKSAPDDESLDRLRISLVPNPDGSVRISTAADPAREARPLGRDVVRIDLVIRAPRAVHIEASASSGKLEVVNMDGGGDLDTASGAISVQNMQGELLTHSVSGATSLQQVFGSVDAQTLSADMDLDSITGEKLFASANHGRIDGRRVRARDVELTTTDGKIVLEVEAALHGRVVVSSLRGDIELHVRRHGPAVIRARGAKVDLGPGLGAATSTVQPQPDGWVQTSLGGGAHPALIEARSRFGMVQFTIATIE